MRRTAHCSSLQLGVERRTASEADGNNADPAAVAGDEMPDPRDVPPVAPDAKQTADRLVARSARVQEALAHATAEATSGRGPMPQEPPSAAGRMWLLGFAIAAVAIGVLRAWLISRYSESASPEMALALRATRALFPIAVLAAAAKLLENEVIGRLHDRVARFNLRRVLRLVVALACVGIVVSVAYQEWAGTLISFGILSLIIGFALQTPITSFIGWIYILTRKPYRVGDRIRVGEATGDVIDVSYLDTTLWEFGGEYLSSDHPSGRLIKFPNANILSQAVWNYSWPLFPYIWNEVVVQIGYQSDVRFVGDSMQRVAAEEIGDDMARHVKVYRELLARTPVGDLEIQDRPVVYFRTTEFGWMEAVCRYLVHPKAAGRTKSRILVRMLEELQREPDRALLPRGDAR